VTAPVPLYTRVYMDNHDVTPWVESVSFGTPTRYLEQEFAITTHAWHMFDINARFDIYCSYDSALPWASCVIRQGHILPDKVRTVTVARGSQPLTTVVGKSWSSSSFRKTCRHTMVIVPFWGGYTYNLGLVRSILRKYDGPVGRYQVYNGRNDLAQVLALLCGRASFHYVSGGHPRYPMQPIIVPPGKSYWDAMLDLVEPFALDVYYSEWSNSLHFIDPVARQYWRPTMQVPGSLVDTITAVPENRRKLHRVLVRVPTWR